MSLRPILTSSEMRSAEAQAVAAGTSVEILMERAGAAATEAILRFCGPMPALVLCGPGNNGGDGYVIARLLAEGGADVRVAAAGQPQSKAARAARAAWAGPVEDVAVAAPASLLVDGLFGTGLARPLDAALSERLIGLAHEARCCVAVDVPSGVGSDDGAVLSPVPVCQLTVTFQTLKPAHRLYPAAGFMGRTVIADIGVPVRSTLSEVGRPGLKAPGPDDHKFTRGYVAVLAGTMPGAAALAAGAAARAGAGYVRLVADAPVAGVPAAVVQDPSFATSSLAGARVGALLCGPGLGRDAGALRLLGHALQSGLSLVLDGDALWLLQDQVERFAGLDEPILTPHEGEFLRLFGPLGGSKIDMARAAAARSRAVVVLKGADTVVASPDGRAAIAPPASHWLATAGTGDVLAGTIAALRAGGYPAFEAACAGVWLHGRAAALAGPGLLADDLLRHLPTAYAECL